MQPTQRSIQTRHQQPGHNGTVGLCLSTHVRPKWSNIGLSDAAISKISFKSYESDLGMT